jgi:hypothetical protein
MTRVGATLLAVLLAASAVRASAADDVASTNGETVVVLHGLARSSASMLRTNPSSSRHWPSWRKADSRTQQTAAIDRTPQ